MDSHEFAKFIKQNKVFIVGPPEGFSEEIKSNHRAIALSRMTLQHELALLVLMEQLYRAITINKGIPYHK